MSSMLSNNEIKHLAAKVKEILPQVPLKTIEIDLRVTDSIDETLARLLDGILNFQPEPIEPTTSSSSSQPSSSSTQSLSASSEATHHSPSVSQNHNEISLNTAAKCFEKTPTERMKSFKERREALIEAARRKYILKHDLKF